MVLGSEKMNGMKPENVKMKETVQQIDNCMEVEMNKVLRDLGIK